MNIEVKQSVAVVREGGILIESVQSALDLIATVKYETGCTAMVLPKDAFSAEFWVLSTQLAGEILQKFVNYQMRLGIIGDFSALTAGSKSLHDFIYESNHGHMVCFLPTEAEVLRWLC